MQRKMGVEEQVVVLMPLLEGLDGVNKMSKSLGNYIGITEPPKEIYGKIMSVSDKLMLRYYELLSHISIEELNALKEGLQTGKIHPKRAKEDLALEIVERYWGKDEAIRTKEEFERVFKDKGVPDEIPVRVISGSGHFILSGPKISGAGGLNMNWLPQVLKDTGLAKSTSEALRLIKQGGVKLNGSTVTNADMLLQLGEHLIQVGKRRFYKVIVE
jgi:tyrosyl-tRNA synthetase